MGSLNNAPSWADQWGSGNDAPHEDDVEPKKKESSGNKMSKAKSVASTGLVKAKAAAVVGALKVKSGTTTGIKWIKTQYQKKSSK